MPLLFAFLHHLAAFAFVSVLAVEFVLIRHELNARTARAILAARCSRRRVRAGAVLVVGLLRVFYFEEGRGVLFPQRVRFSSRFRFRADRAAVDLPDRPVLSWRKDLKAGRAPAVSESVRRRSARSCTWSWRRLRSLILNAALMARSIGYAG